MILRCGGPQSTVDRLIGRTNEPTNRTNQPNQPTNQPNHNPDDDLGRILGDWEIGHRVGIFYRSIRKNGNKCECYHVQLGLHKGYTNNPLAPLFTNQPIGFSRLVLNGIVLCYAVLCGTVASRRRSVHTCILECAR